MKSQKISFKKLNKTQTDKVLSNHLPEGSITDTLRKDIAKLKVGESLCLDIKQWKQKSAPAQYLSSVISKYKFPAKVRRVKGVILVIKTSKPSKS